MSGLVLYGIGSPIVGDVVESAHRAGTPIRLGIRNVAGPALTEAGIPTCPAEAISHTVRDHPILVPLFTPGHRQGAAREATGHGLVRHAVLVDPTCIRPRDLAIGPGGYVNAGCVFGSGGVLGAFAFVNRATTIGHHARFGDFVSIGPGVSIAGEVTIGDGAVIGAGAVLLPGISIGANAVVGGGAVVTRDVPPECLVLGNPARVIRRAIGGYKGVTVS